MPAGTRDNIAELKAVIADLDTQLAGPTFDAVGAYPEELALAVSHVVSGSGGAPGAPAPVWSDLSDTKLGWARTPIWGYKDLQARLPDYGDKNATEPGKLDPRVDRNEDGQPDLVIDDDTVDVGRVLGLPAQMQFVFAIAPFALGAGFITGRAGLLVLAGGILAYFVVNPVVYSMGWLPATVAAKDAPAAAWQAFDRPLGIGLLLGGAMMGMVASLPAILAALKSIAGAGRITGRGGREELGLAPLVIAVIAAGVLLFLAADHVGNEPLNKGGLCPVTGLEVSCAVEPEQYGGYAIAFADEDAKNTWASGAASAEAADAKVWNAEAKDAYLTSMHAKRGLLASLNPHVRAGVIALVGVLWIWFAGIIISQCTGMTDWSPISGMALLTVVLVLLLAGSGSVMGAVLIGAALCVAITLAADMMGDLKTGHLVGARPIRQQITEMLTVPIGPIVTMFTILLIVAVNMKSFGVPLGPGTPTQAPQALALQAVIEGVQGGQMPYALYGLGAGLGALLGLGSFAGLGVLVGLSMYLPFKFIATYGLGCIANILVRAFKGPRWAEEWGVPFAAGLIVGESILALIFNIIILALG
ncbi:MAG: OPT/YSL family transporter [Phycisphaerales bacterium]|nr:OPT/YSL family transporter [Phycisphaerales bacterium]